MRSLPPGAERAYSAVRSKRMKNISARFIDPLLQKKPEKFTAFTASVLRNPTEHRLRLNQVAEQYHKPSVSLPYSPVGLPRVRQGDFTSSR
jgi:hypothetical protein